MVQLGLGTVWPGYCTSFTAPVVELSVAKTLEVVFWWCFGCYCCCYSLGVGADNQGSTTASSSTWLNCFVVILMGEEKEEPSR